MIFVVASEIIPNIQSKVAHGRGALSLMAGLAAMMFFDVTFG